jgi:hypothetical protein
LRRQRLVTATAVDRHVRPFELRVYGMAVFERLPTRIALILTHRTRELGECR